MSGKSQKTGGSGMIRTCVICCLFP